MAKKLKKKTTKKQIISQRKKVQKKRPEKKLSAKKSPPKRVGTKKAEKKRKIGLFGGTFDPVHFGHLNSVETILKDLKFDEVWIVPTRQNPFREPLQKPSPEQRLEMVRLALKTLEADGQQYKVCDEEIRRSGISYTIDTLAALKKQNKNVEFTIVIGADQLAGFSKWKDYKKILKAANLVVTSRPNSDLPKEKSELPDWLKVQAKSYRGEKVALKSGSEVRFFHLKDLNISGTDVRRKIRRGESIEHMIPAVVLEYIKANKIYDPSDVLVSDYSDFTKFCGHAISDKGGLSVNAYDVRSMVQPAEYTLAASGTSTRHTRALAEHVVKQAKEKYGIYPQSLEGQSEGRWIVIDFGALMIHIFYDYVRNEYRIEDLWSNAAKLSL